MLVHKSLFHKLVIHKPPYHLTKRALSGAIAKHSTIGCLLAGSVIFSSHTMANDQIIEEVVTIGSRVAGRTATEAAVPIDVISSDDLSKSGFTDLGQSLQATAPSFNFSRTQISDGADLFRPATLRGLGPDQTLVLINGKRRHTQSIFQTANTIGGGSAGTDINAIPLSALQAVEVLRDGAAAQYGSDAIAGVINLKLKDTTDETTGFIQGGSTGEGDGDTVTFGLNTGIDLGGDGGFINVTVEYRDFDSTNRANPGWFQGDAEGEFETFFYNAMLPVGDGEFYSFGGYSNRTALGGGFRRVASSVEQVVLQVTPDGFLPNIGNEAEDISFSFGYRQELVGDWTMDASFVYGENTYDFESSNTINASIAAEYLFNNPGASDADIAANAGPRSGYSGGYGFDQLTFNLDIAGSVDFAGSPLYVALGAEHRDESYEIRSGILESYSCGTDPDATTSFPAVNDPMGEKFAGCGFQAFSGVQPNAETDASRESYAVYVDLERNLTDSWLLGLATRYEDYDGIGDELSSKLSSRFDFTESFAIRGALSTGFRAPSLQQSAYTAYQTNLSNDGVLERSFTAAAGSALPVALGIDGLDIETSTSASLGFVWSPIDNLTVTLDAYRIEIEDRIALGGLVDASTLVGNQTALDALAATGVSGASFFSNALNTTTDGVDLIVIYDTEFIVGDLNITFAANVNNTTIDSFNVPAGSTDSQVYPNQNRRTLTDGQPGERGTLTFNWTNGGLGTLLRLNYYGETEIDFFAQNHIPIPGTQPTSVVESNVLVDLDVSYDITDNFTVSVGGSNIFDERPDELESDEVLSVISGGGFKYPVRAVPYGFNGSSYYLKVAFSF
jgi:iron complex outermembrane recepter protein